MKKTPLESPVTALDGIGPKRAELLANLGIGTVRDLVFHFPRTHQDRRTITPVAEVRAGDTVTIEAMVLKSRVLRLRKRRTLTEATLEDASGTIRATWFGPSYLTRTLTPDAKAVFTGRAYEHRELTLKNPDYEVVSGDEKDPLATGRLVPVYPKTEGITQRMLRCWVHAALENVDATLKETLPGSIRKRYAYPPIHQAILALHYPKEPEEAETARNRFVYEELLGIQLGVLGLRAARHAEETGNRHVVDGPSLRALRDSLPFALTQAQEQAVSDILLDMASARPMLRLLQGDVGCGKTVVALHAIAAAADGGYQTALMAPTEILAEQHGMTLRTVLEPLGLNVEVLTGSIREAAKVRRRIVAGKVHVVVGTHALIQEKTAFRKLGFVIIDEQHRFGVLQRSKLAAKGLNPDILHMTATPIPRTLAITVYGAMDITVIDELPPGRLPVKTRRVPPKKVRDLYGYISDQAGQGYQTYFICPLIEESVERQATAVTRHYEQLSAGPFTGLRTALLHGRLPSQEKEGIMARFKRGEVDVLFSTSVIEVGIDEPKAVNMVIEDAAEFGLTQLHQLRGRVGRGKDQAHCFLLGKPKTPEGEQRVQILCETSSGFDIAEEDLRLRGPGEFYGVRQAGLSDLRVADLIRDVRALDASRRDAQKILERDPHLERPQHKHLASTARRFQMLNA